MTLRFHRNFQKQLKKLSRAEQNQTKERLKLFLLNPFQPILNNHPLRGKYEGYRSINISGDLRALYCKVGKDEYRFMAIDTHSNLYS